MRISTMPAQGLRATFLDHCLVFVVTLVLSATLTFIIGGTILGLF